MRSKEFTFKAFGCTHTVIAKMERYSDESLCITILERTPEGYEEEWGILTTNIPIYPKLKENWAPVKTYAENEPWAQQALDALQAKDTGVRLYRGYVKLPVYEFDLEQIFTEQS